MQDFTTNDALVASLLGTTTFSATLTHEGKGAIQSLEVETVFRKCPREFFVPASGKAQAYWDRPLLCEGIHMRYVYPNTLFA
jgi:protein-L-isoaspartate O-methyltransferase